MLAVAATALTLAVRPPDPCTLVTRAEAAQAVTLPLQAKPIRADNALFRQCEWVSPGGGDASVTVQTRTIGRATFLSMARAQAAPVKAVRGLGQLAFSTGGQSLLVWDRGLEVRLYVVDPTRRPLSEMVVLAHDALRRV
jgi:hypothetical protein